MPEAISRQALSELIGAIYDCALDPGRWEATLGGIMEAFDAATAVLGLTDVPNDRLLISKSVGITPYWLEQLARHGPEINRVIGEALASWPSLDDPYIISRHGRDYLDTSPYYNNVLRPQGMVDVIQYFLMVTPERLAAIGIGRHERNGLITEREIELGGLLLPHIRRAVTISNVLEASTIREARMTEALDTLRCGVVLTDERSAILHANRSADEMLQMGVPITGAGGVLGVRSKAAAKELNAAIRQAAIDEVSIGKAGLAVRLTEDHEPPRYAHVLPMNGSDLRTRLRPAAAAIFISRGERDTADGDVLAAAFGLTRAETQVLMSLLSGRNRAETAAHLGITLATAKTHLARIFEKTGVNRQAELMRLASGMLPTARAGS